MKERGLEQAAHGVYVSSDTWIDAMYVLHLRCNQAVFSHDTAFFHNLTDREPLKYAIFGGVTLDNNNSKAIKGFDSQSVKE